MIKTDLCAECGKSITANGYWKLLDALRNHWASNHPQRYAEIKEHNLNVDRQIRTLEKTKISLSHSGRGE